MNHTPDIRTRAILTDWCCSVNVKFCVPTLNAQAISRLFETAGNIIGIGDYRQEKGKGNYGQFHIDFEGESKAIMSKFGIKEQDKAIESPDFYDVETQSLYKWFVEEKQRRGR